MAKRRSKGFRGMTPDQQEKGDIRLVREVFDVADSSIVPPARPLSKAHMSLGDSTLRATMESIVHYQQMAALWFMSLPGPGNNPIAKALDADGCPIDVVIIGEANTEPRSGLLKRVPAAVGIRPNDKTQYFPPDRRSFVQSNPYEPSSTLSASSGDEDDTADADDFERNYIHRESLFDESTTIETFELEIAGMSVDVSILDLIVVEWDGVEDAHRGITTGAEPVRDRDPSSLSMKERADLLVGRDEGVLVCQRLTPTKFRLNADMDLFGSVFCAPSVVVALRVKEDNHES